jgi:hypothetical protein
MKRISSVSANFILLALITFPVMTGAEVHKGTASPSGRYKLASESIYQKEPDGSKMGIGAKICLIGRDGAVISKCFTPSEAYVDVDPDSRGCDDWQTKGYWNNDETMVAVCSRGRTWSKIDFYSIIGDRIAILPHPDWDFGLLKGMPGYQGETIRLYEGFSKWMTNDTCMMVVDGTAFLDESQQERYPQFSDVVTIRIALEGIQVGDVKKKDG